MISNIKSLFKGLGLIIIISALLLYSDLNNRNKGKERKVIFIEEDSYEIKAEAGKTYKVGLVYFAPEEAHDNLLRGLFEGLSEHGFVKDSNLNVIFSHANAEIINIPTILQNLDNSDVDLIITTSTPCLTAAGHIIKNKPIVFTYVSDPIAAGIGKSFEDHLPNLTGIGSFPPVEKTIEFIKIAFPDVKSIGTIYNSSEANSRKVAEVAREICKDHNLGLEEMTITNSNEAFQATQAIISRDIQVLWVSEDNSAIQSIDGIIKITQKAKMPLVLNTISCLDHGAFAAIGLGWYFTGYKTAPLVARVLLGENPSNIPIQNVGIESGSINMDIAKKLGIDITKKMSDFMAGSQQKITFAKMMNFALVQYVDAPLSEESMDGILDGLFEHGLERDVDFDFTVYNAQGDIGTLNSIVDAVKSMNYDLIFLTSTPTFQAIIKKIKDVNIVFTAVGDPVDAGGGTSFEEHLPNITGISTLSDFEGMVLLLKKIIPGIKKIGTLYTPGEANSVLYHKHLAKAAARHGLILESMPVFSTIEVQDATSALISKEIDAFCQLADNLISSTYTRIITIAKKERIPYFSFATNQVEDGGLAAVGRDYYEGGKDAVKLAVRVFNGEKPADIPFEYISKTNISINLDVADFYGITIPDSILNIADFIIHNKDE